MKISNSKKQLAKIISENGGWREGAKFAALDQDGEVFFYTAKPTRSGGWWLHDGELCGVCIVRDEAMPNWHQTILSRDEYFHLYPAPDADVPSGDGVTDNTATLQRILDKYWPDADGWIKWSGGECPLRGGVDGLSIEYRTASGGIEVATEWDILELGWVHQGTYDDVEAYRVVSAPDEPAKPTIDQLAAEYRNRQDYAERKQEEADAAKADAEAKLAELVAAGKELGLVLSVAAPELELVITDWRDLKVGDEVECVDYEDKYRFGVVISIDEHGEEQCVEVSNHNGEVSWPSKWRFIRRP